MAKQATPPEDERDTTRVQLDMPPRSMDRLRALKDKTEAASYAEVLRNALRFYEFLVEEAEQGKVVVTEDKDGGGRRTVLVHQ